MLKTEIRHWEKKCRIFDEINIIHRFKSQVYNPNLADCKNKET